MSRIGKQPIEIPANVSVAVDSSTVVVKGPKGELQHKLPDLITVEVTGSQAMVYRSNDERYQRALHGLTRTLISNMVSGVSNGFTKELEIVGVGYRAQAKGDTTLDMSLGFSHPVTILAPQGISFEVPAPTRIIIKGIDKALVGQVAANIRKLRKPEPYKGKGIRYAGERILRKAGKTGK
jgi:large subunit ribosomal protein L6